MRLLLSMCCVAALGAGCAQMQKDLDQSASYGAGQAQGRIDEDTGQTTTDAAKAGADAEQRVEGPGVTVTSSTAP